MEGTEIQAIDDIVIVAILTVFVHIFLDRISSAIGIIHTVCKGCGRRLNEVESRISGKSEPTIIGQSCILGQGQFASFYPIAPSDAEYATGPIHANGRGIATAHCFAQTVQAIFRDGLVCHFGCTEKINATELLEMFKSKLS